MRATRGSAKPAARRRTLTPGGVVRRLPRCTRAAANTASAPTTTAVQSTTGTVGPQVQIDGTIADDPLGVLARDQGDERFVGGDDHQPGAEPRGARGGALPRAGPPAHGGDDANGDERFERARAPATRRHRGGPRRGMVQRDEAGKGRAGEADRREPGPEAGRSGHRPHEQPRAHQVQLRGEPRQGSEPVDGAAQCQRHTPARADRQHRHRRRARTHPFGAEAGEKHDGCERSEYPGGGERRKVPVEVGVDQQEVGRDVADSGRGRGDRERHRDTEPQRAGCGRDAAHYRGLRRGAPRRQNPAGGHEQHRVPGVEAGEHRSERGVGAEGGGGRDVGQRHGRRGDQGDRAGSACRPPGPSGPSGESNVRPS